MGLLAFPKRYVGPLTFGTYKCDLIWKECLCRSSQDEVIRVVPNPIYAVSEVLSLFIPNTVLNVNSE